jgi:ferredoxin
MKINVTPYACQGHARCLALAPELFDHDDEGLAVLLIDGDIPAELEEKARLAAQRCPEFAIEIIEE